MNINGFIFKNEGVVFLVKRTKDGTWDNKFYPLKTNENDPTYNNLSNEYYHFTFVHFSETRDKIVIEKHYEDIPVKSETFQSMYDKKILHGYADIVLAQLYPIKSNEQK